MRRRARPSSSSRLASTKRRGACAAWGTIARRSATSRAARRRWPRRGARCASRCARPTLADDIETHARLAELLPTGALRQALERRLGLVRARAGDVAGARPALQAAAADGDRVALADLAELERADGRSRKRRRDGARHRSRARRRAGAPIGSSRSANGSRSSAASAMRPLPISRAAEEYPDDPRAARALERPQAAGGGKEAALMRHLQAAERSPARAPMELTYAARLLRELGRNDEALARLDMALTAAPSLGPALDLAVELQLAAGRADEAAAVLGRAADASDEPSLAQAFRMRAARMLLASAAPATRWRWSARSRRRRTCRRAARWLEERILRAAEGQIDALSRQLRAEADAPSRGRQAARRRARLRARAPRRRRRRSASTPGGACSRSILGTAPPSSKSPRAPTPIGAPPSCRALLQAASTPPARARKRSPWRCVSARRCSKMRAIAAAAARVYADAATRAPGYAPAREGLDRVATASDRSRRAPGGARARARRRRGSREAASPLDLVLGERLERDGHPTRPSSTIATRSRRAPVTRWRAQALERALQAPRPSRRWPTSRSPI